MATFYTATQAAMQYGYTHLKAADGQLTPLDTIHKRMTPAGLPVHGWHFHHESYTDPRITLHHRKHTGFYELHPKPEPCQHPPARLHSWHAGDTLCACCNECGAVLAGGAE